MNGKDLISFGYTPGPHFAEALQKLPLERYSKAEVAAVMKELEPEQTLPLQSPAPCHYNINVTTSAEQDNLAKVRQTMDVLLRTPGVVEAAVMPDACPAGPVGVIPVGAVVGVRNGIVPGMHSSDICCSLMLTSFGDTDPKVLLDAVHETTHFGPCRPDQPARYSLPEDMREFMETNSYFDKVTINIAERDLGTQGDGNHFAYVGWRQSTGDTVLVTHHGSRGVGARLYKAGKRVAEKFRHQLSPATSKHNAWIPYDTQEGRDYWAALQFIRYWTKTNHNIVHKAAADKGDFILGDSFWNEHNFVFKDGDTFWHAKGATPLLDKYLPDTSGIQIVPLNMAEPILLVQGERTTNNLGFAPHGAGRNFSRTQHLKSLGDAKPEEIIARETVGIDARFWCDKHDLSELPSAYKDADSVRDDIQVFKLAEVVDKVIPYGTIMAGDWEAGAPWRKK